MRLLPRSAALLLACALLSGTARAQGIVMDQGTFAITVGGRSAGTEEFIIRRAGLGRTDAYFASAVVRLQQGDVREIRPLLRATPEGAALEYELDVVGTDSLHLGMSRGAQRYRALITSEEGEEYREFPALPGTRLLERDVAHQYYFLRDVRGGSSIPMIEPRSRSRGELTAGTWAEEEIVLGRNSIQSRRLELSSGGERRVVWFDRLGRVLRVSIPSRAYVAERTDLAS